MKNNKNMFLKDYKNKYKNKLNKGKLLTFKEKEVEDFDKAHRFYKYNNKEYKLREHLLLDKKKKYKLLEDTYCQIPSKKGICIGASIALVLAIGGVTSYFLINKFKPTTDVIKEDKQIVNAINESIKGSSFTTPHEFVSTIRERKENPILIDELQPVNKDMKYAYNLKNNEVVILNDKDEITYSNTATKDKCDVWKFMDSYSKSTTTIKDTYGTYLKKKSKTNNTLKYTASSNDQETLVFNSNIDVGYNKDIPLKYEKTTEEATVPMVVTNHNDLEIDGALGDISHYGHATSITVSDLSGSYNEYGTVDGDIIVKGDTPVKIAVQETAIVNSIIVANTSNESTITVPDKANVGTIVATTTSGVDISNIVKASDEKKKEVVETEPVNPEELKDFSGGLGTEKSPFTIDLKSQLVNLSTLVAGEGGYESKSYKVTADIDLKDTAFTPIGSRAKPFSGNFDGGNNTISNLSVDNSKKQLDSVGLFGCVYNEYLNTSFKDVEDVWNYDTNLFDETCIDETHYKSKITNITIDNINLINKETKYTGAIIGKCKNVYVSNCKVNSGTINGFKNVGGIVGETSYSVIKGCETGSNVEVIAEVYNVGGICGTGQNDTDEGKYSLAVIDCTNNAKITAKVGTGGYIGGIGGMFQAQPATSVLNNCVNNGEVICLTGAAGVSGILGQGNCTHLLSNCTNTAKVSSSNTNDTTYISGICCYNDAYYYNCTNTGDLEGHPSSTTGVHDTDGSMAGIMAGFYNGTSKRSGIVNCYNKGNMINHNQACRDISNIAAGIGDIEMKDMTFATTEELAQAIVTAIGQYSCVRLTNVTVTDHSGVLEIPNGINEITSNLPICSSLKLNTSKNYLNTNVPDLNITVDSDAYSHVFINCAGSNNTITINQGAKIGTVTVSGANSKIINNGTAGAICINEAATYGENNGTCTSVSFNEYNTQLVGYNKEFINHGTIKTTATRDNAHVINSIGEGTNKFVFKNYGTVEYEMTPEAETAKKAPGYLYLFYNHADNEVYNYPGAVVKTDRNKSLGYSFALHGNLTYHHAQSNDDGITFAGELVKFSSMYNPKITFTADL